MLTNKQKLLIKKYENEDVKKMALNKSAFENQDAIFVLSQIRGRQIAKQKIPSWYENEEIVYPPHLSMEQASSEINAKFKAGLLNNIQSFADLTGGLGVDFSFMSQKAEVSHYVESNKFLCDLTKHNFQQLKLKNYTVNNTNAESFLNNTTKLDCIYIDPARRDNTGKKVFRIEDCQPNIIELQGMLFEKSEKVLIKFSPILDISLAEKSLKNVSQIYAISVENECKELLFILDNNQTETEYFAVNILKNGMSDIFKFNKHTETSLEFAENVKDYLYEPNASIMKIGAFNQITAAYPVVKLEKNSHLYTSSEIVKNFPGRTFKVIETIIPNKKNIRELVKRIPKANLTVRNFPSTVDKIRKESGLKEGGEHYIFATFVNNQHVWIVSKKAAL